MDPVLSRFGVGSLARLATSSGQGAALVFKSGGLEALVKSLRDADGQTVCYAAKAAGALGVAHLRPSNASISRESESEMCMARALIHPTFHQS